MTWTVRFKPHGKGRWLDLSYHSEQRQAERAWFGWLMIVPYLHCSWIVEHKEERMIEKTPDDGRNPKAILAALEARGVKLAIEGDNLRKTAGTLTKDDAEDIKSCKTELFMLLWEREQVPTLNPWSDADAASFLANAQTSFKEFWNDIEKDGVVDAAKLRAAGAILCDALAMLADAQRDRDLDLFKRKCLNVSWLCHHVREKLK